MKKIIIIALLILSLFGIKAIADNMGMGMDMGMGTGAGGAAPSAGDTILWDVSGDKILWDISGDEMLWE